MVRDGNPPASGPSDSLNTTKGDRMEIVAKVVTEAQFKRAIRYGSVVGRSELGHASFKVGQDLWFIAQDQGGSVWHGRVPDYFNSGTVAP